MVEVHLSDFLSVGETTSLNCSHPHFRLFHEYLGLMVLGRGASLGLGFKM